MKMSLIKTALVFLILPLFLVSCGSKAPEKEWKPKRARPKVEAAATAEQAETEVDAVQKEVTAGKLTRNPFQSYMVLRKGRRKAAKIKGPLECCELNLFRVVAMAVGQESSYALVLAPDSKRYIVRRGDLIGVNSGRVVRIDSGGITVREYKRDEHGRIISSQDNKLKLPSRGEGGTMAR